MMPHVEQCDFEVDKRSFPKLQHSQNQEPFFFILPALIYLLRHRLLFFQAYELRHFLQRNFEDKNMCDNVHFTEMSVTCQYFK